MLAFDIETTGLQPTDTITCACLYDPEKNISKTYIFSLGNDHNDFIREMDNADQLCAFNGARFDIPFMQKAWNIPLVKIQAWRLKLFDVYETCVQVYKSGFSLNQLLACNGISSKTGTGKEAITLAHEGRWMDLGEYCMQDTIKTYQVSSMPKINLPLRLGMAICLINNGSQPVYLEVQ